MTRLHLASALCVLASLLAPLRSHAQRGPLDVLKCTLADQDYNERYDIQGASQSASSEDACAEVCRTTTRCNMAAYVASVQRCYPKTVPFSQPATEARAGVTLVLPMRSKLSCGGEAGPVSVQRDVALPSVDPDGTKSTADVYFLPDGVPRPLLVVVPGAFGDKAWYSGIANDLASAGDGVVVVVQQNRSLPTPAGPLSGNLPSKWTVNEAVEWAKALPAGGDTDRPAVAATEVYAIGHSLGAVSVVEALTDGDEGVTMPAEVKSSLVFGFSLWQRFSSSWNPITNDGGPLTWINGSGDSTGSPDTDVGTFERLKAPSVHAVIENLSHFSIADRYFSAIPRPGEVESTLPRGEQVALVAQCVRAWLYNPLDSGPEGSVEKALRDTYARGAVVSYTEQL